MSTLTVLAVVGNPRPESRTHRLARTLAGALASALPEAETAEGPPEGVPGSPRHGRPGGDGAVAVLLGGSPGHRLAVDVHLTPLLPELGASVPARSMFVVESELDGFADHAAWVRAHRASLLGPLHASGAAAQS